MSVAFCPECEEEIDLGERAEIGQLLECPSCGVELEVIDLQPLTLDHANLEDDWDDYDDDDDDEDFDE